MAYSELERKQAVQLIVTQYRTNRLIDRAAMGRVYAGLVGLTDALAIRMASATPITCAGRN